MKRQIVKIFSLAMSVTFLVISLCAMNASATVYLTEEQTIEDKREEDISDNEILTVPYENGTVEEEGNDFSTDSYVARTTLAIESDSLGGKMPTDKYLRVSRHPESSSKGDYFAFRNSDGYATNNGELPLNVEFSICLEQETGSDKPGALRISFVLIDGTGTSPIRNLRFTTDEGSASVPSYFDETIIYIKPYEWNRIKVKLYPETSNSEVTVNGVTRQFEQIKDDGSVWGKNFNHLRFTLPNSPKNFSFGIDDAIVYRGYGDDMPYSEPSGILTSSDEHIIINEDLRYIFVEAPVTEQEITAAVTLDNGEYFVVKGDDDYAEAVVIWESGNPVPKKYTVVLLEQLSVIKSEDFTGKTITSPAPDGSIYVDFVGENGLGASYYMARVKGEINADSLGGKDEDDEYLLIERNRQTSDSPNADHLALNISKSDEYRSIFTPMIFEFSFLVPNLGSEIIRIGVAMRDDESTSPTGYVTLSTNKSMAIIGETVSNSIFYVTPNAWSRIALKVYPNSNELDVIVNGEVTKFENLSTAWGTYFRAVRINLPSHETMPDCFFAVDDVKLYRGVGDLVYSMPTSSVTSNSPDVLVNEDEKVIYTKTVLDEQEIMNVLTATGEETYRIAKNKEGNPAAIVFIEEGNLLYKNYEIEVLTEGVTELLSLEKDFNTKTFSALVKGNGETFGIMIVTEYDGNTLVNVVIVPKKTIFGVDTIVYTIDTYDPNLTYKAFYWKSLETLEPVSTPVQF